MWKPVGVVGLWLVLIALPHLGSRPVHVGPTGVQVAAMVPTDDPSDTYREEAPKAKKAAEVPNAIATIRFKNALDKTLTLVSATLVPDGEPLAPITNLAP